ncbi:MAG: hypothetical protein GY835_06860 [bacterium]|nr:hypothetical protein [bacterium]
MKRTFLLGPAYLCLCVCLQFNAVSAAYNPLAGNDDDLFTRSVAVDDGLTSLYTNPAGLAMHPGEWGLLYMQGLRDPGGVRDEGVGFNGEWSVALGGKLAFGIDHYHGLSGYDTVIESGDRTPLYRTLRRYNLGFAQALSLRQGNIKLAMGGVWRYTTSDAYTLDGLSTCDLGLLIRWRSALSLGFKARNITSPTIKGLFPGDRNEVSSEFTYGVAFRAPLSWLTISADLHQIRDGSRWDKTLNIAAEAQLQERLSFRFGFDSKNRVNIGFAMSFGHMRGQCDIGRSTKSSALQTGMASLELRNRIFGSAIIPNRRVLRLELTGTIPDTPSANSSSGQGLILDTWTILKAIRTATLSHDIAGILVILNHPQLTLAQCEEIRVALLDFREQTGKSVIFYSERYDLVDYYLASAGSHISLNPLGTIWFNNFRHERPYLGSALRNLGINPQFISHSECSQTLYQLSADSPSPCAHAADSTYLAERFQLLKSELAQARGLEEISFVPIFRQRHFTPEQAVNRNLIDDIVYADQLSGYLARVMGQSRVISSGSLLNRTYSKQSWGEDTRIALVYLDGVLTREEVGSNPLGHSTSAAHLSALMRIVREDDRYKGLVLRINSSGGDALASEVIRHELRLTGLEMPIVVSVGHKAVGGGYLASLAGERILVDRFSTVGGINALGGKFHLQTAPGDQPVTIINQRLELGDNTLGTWLPYSAADLERLDERVAYFYDKFSSAVASTRHIDEVEMTHIGKGRLLSGSKSVRLRLTSEIGGLQAAMTAMRDLLSLEPERKLQVVQLPMGMTSSKRFRLTYPSHHEVSLGYTSGDGSAFEDLSLFERLRRLDGEQIFYYEALPGEGIELLHFEVKER